MIRLGPSLPVLVHHSIAPGEKMDPALFEAHLQVLVRSGLPSLTADELDTAGKGFLLTFDDGFADLWTHGLPLLERYGVRAVVFAVVERAGDGEPRPQGEVAYSGRAPQALREGARSRGPHPGFLRWSELAALERSGLVEVQSHTWDHAMGWIGENIVGFHLGGGHWSLPHATGGDERLGIPLYPRGSASAHRLYFDDPGLRDALAEWLEEKGGAGYVVERGAEKAREELFGAARGYLAAHPEGGRWETDAERRERVAGDFARARETLQARLGGSRDELCLPWGQFDDVALECARRVGVRRVYTTGRGPNLAGRIGFLVSRFGPVRRRNGARWLRSRLWIYRSGLRAGLYGALYGITLPGMLGRARRLLGLSRRPST